MAPNVGSILAGHSGPVEVRYELFLSNIGGNEVAPIPHDVYDGTVNLSNFRDNTWEMNLSMRANDLIDPTADYLKPVMDVWNRGTWERWPLGLYRCGKPGHRHMESMTEWSVNGESPEVLLAEDMASGGYVASITVGILAQVRQILVDHGVPLSSIAFPPDDKFLRNEVEFSPFQDADGCFWLRICNSLLGAGGFYALQTDAAGRFITEPLRDDLTQHDADVSYGAISVKDAEQLIVGDVDDNWGDEAFANHIVMLSTDANDTPPMMAEAKNLNPDSRGSIPALGRTITKVISVQTAVSQAELNVQAIAELQASSGYYRRLNIVTLPDPRRGPRETYNVELSNLKGEVIVDGRWAVTNWTLPLSSPPQAMTHEISRVEKV